MTRRLQVILASIGLVLGAGSAHGGEPASLASGEAALTGRLIAPCCWVQTLDVHESEEASSLRAEIHARLLARESASAIEDDFARRFGERVRAVPRGADPRAVVATIFGIVAALVSVALGFMIRGWTRSARSRPLVDNRTRETSADEDARLDEELRALDT